MKLNWFVLVLSLFTTLVLLFMHNWFLAALPALGAAAQLLVIHPPRKN